MISGEPVIDTGTQLPIVTSKGVSSAIQAAISVRLAHTTGNTQAMDRRRVDWEATVAASAPTSGSAMRAMIRTDDTPVSLSCLAYGSSKG